MRVVLVYPNQTHLEELSSRWKYPNVRPRPEPIVQLGLGYIYAAVSKYHKTFYIDNNIAKLSDVDLFRWIEARHPDVVGFGGTLSEWPQAKNVSKLLSDNIITVYGGPNATANPKKHVQYFDYVLRGYAEETMLGFLKAIEDEYGYESLERIPGLCWLGKISKPCFLVDNITLKSRPYRNLKGYKRADAAVCPDPVDVVTSSRGCPFACRFCSSKTVWSRTYIERDVDDVLDEVHYMVQTYGSRTIHFREDNFTINKNRLEAMCRGLAKENVKWICQSRPKSLDREMIRMMMAGGCILVCCGFESINDTTLAYVNKGHTADDVRHTIDALEAEGLSYSGGFMVGVLNEGEDDIRQTLEFTRILSQRPHSFIPRGAGRFVGFPVSETYYEMIEQGLVEYDWQQGELLIPRTYKLTAKQVEDCMDRYW